MIKTSTLLFKTFPLFLLFITQTAIAQLQNIACTGYNADVVANGTGLASTSTNNDIDGNAYVFIDNTFKAKASCTTTTTNVWKTSLPTTGTSSLTYTMQAANINNDLRLTSGSTGRLTLVTPISASKLYFLACGGWGACPTTVRVNFTDNSYEIVSGITVADWCSGGSTQVFNRKMTTDNTCGASTCPYLSEKTVNISSINQYRKIASVDFTNGITAGVLNVFALAGVATTPPACATPSAQPTALILTPNPSSVAGSFTAASGADSYLIIRSTSNSLGANPINGISYSTGNTVGSGTVVGFQSGTTFTDLGLAPGTIYYYFVYSANSNCSAGPNYLTSNPLSNTSTATTTSSATFTSSGTWVCPAGVNSVTVECWAAGGGGGSNNGGGGGGGAYKKSISISVTPGASYAVAVGQYGLAGLPLVNGGNGGDGGNSSFNVTTLVANGGKGGKGGTNGKGGGTGGTGGTYDGGKGANGGTSNGGGGGGGAGSTQNGGNTSTITGGNGGNGNGGSGGSGSNSGNGNNASTYGGGGGGGNNNGGCGANGQVIVTCNSCPSFTPSFSASPTANTCVGVNVTYSTQMGLSNYTWTVSGTAGTDYTIVSGGIGSTNNTVTLKWLTTGTKTVTASYNIGTCTATGNASNTTTVYANPTVTISPASPTSCVGSTIAITANPTGGSGTYDTHTWTGTGLSATDIANPAFTNASAGTYPLNYTVIDNRGCIGTASTSVAVNPLPTALVLNGSTVCSGTSTTITSISSASGIDYQLYNNLNATIGSAITGTGSSLIWSDIPSGTDYYVISTNNTSSCSSIASNAVNVVVNQTPAILDKTISVCSGESFSFTPIHGTDGILSAGTTYSWAAPSATNITGITSQTDAASVNDILTNTSASLQFIYYSVTPALGSCYGTAFNVSVSVKPSPTVTVTDGYICETGSANFVAEANIVGSSFNWFNNPTGGTSIATGSTYLTGILSASTSYYVEAEYDGCKAASRTQASVLLVPSNSTWTGAVSTEWNDAGNWTNGIPGACTKANIGQSTRYPDISGVLNNVVCEKITFEPETSIYGLEKLTYDSAQIKVEFARNKWYMLTSPLKEMYSGDYYMEGAPVTNMKLFSTNIQASPGTNVSTVTGQWTNSFASLKETLSPGEGFAYLIDSKEYHYPSASTSSTADLSFTLPRTNADGSLKKAAVPYSAVTGKLYPSMAQTMPKDDSKAYRFSMEDASNQLTSISIPVKVGFNLIGNPLMSNLDFVKLQAHNPNIKPFVQFWNGSDFESITTSGLKSGTAVDGTSLVIPPMKSFVVEAIADGYIEILLSDFTAANTLALKTARVDRNTLYIESNNGLAKSSTSLVMNTTSSNIIDQDDVSKLYTQTAQVPEVYTISGKKALGINQFSSFPYIVPVGVKSGGADSVSLNFKGVESFEGVEVKLINTATSETQDLKANCTYCFKTDGSNTEGSLFLEFRSASATTENEELTSSNSGIQIFTGSNNSVNVLSSVENKALEILVYDPLGKLVSRKTALSNTSESVTINHPGKVFIVKVVSEKGVETKKVVID